MSSIMIQSANDKDSRKATNICQAGGQHFIDMSNSSALLQPISFVPRYCTEIEKTYLLFGEAVCG